MKAIEDLHLGNILLALLTLSGCRWSARCVNLSIVHRCMPAILECLLNMNEVQAAGFLKSISNPTPNNKWPHLLFGVEFLMLRFLGANVTYVGGPISALRSYDLLLSYLGVSDPRRFVDSAHT